MQKQKIHQRIKSMGKDGVKSCPDAVKGNRTLKKLQNNIELPIPGRIDGI